MAVAEEWCQMRCGIVVPSLSMANGVKDLRVWQEAVALGGDTLRLVRQSSRRETKAFTDEILRMAAVPAACIAEAHTRPAVDEQRECYLRARRALAELETRCAIARSGELLTAPAMAQLSTRIGAVAQLLGGYLGFIERQMARVERVGT
jgi:four helix bundle protein